MQVVYHYVSMVFLGCFARIVGGFYLVSCPGCGLKLALVGIFVVMLGGPVCGVWFWWLYRADAPFLMFWGRCCPFVVFPGSRLGLFCYRLFVWPLAFLVINS